jgi:putative transposase
MVLKSQYGVVYNLKRIRRIMKKYNIFCPYRKANPYIRMVKATKEHKILPNVLNRNFKQNITYLFYKNKSKKTYLSTIKYASTNEIMAYNISDSLTLDIVIDTITNLKKSKSVKFHPEAFINSDQGSHYTTLNFRSL